MFVFGALANAKRGYFAFSSDVASLFGLTNIESMEGNYGAAFSIHVPKFL
jgi:hypothetical protein